MSDVLGGLLLGSGARLSVLDGNLRWIPLLTGADPVRLPKEPGTELTWQTDQSGWVSDVTVSWTDGTSYTATRPDGRRQSRAIDGVHAVRAVDRAYADWVVSSATAGGRIPLLPYDLVTLSEADATLLAGIDLGTRVILDDLPPQMPHEVGSVVEGIDEAIGVDEWALTLKLSPDPMATIFILDDPERGRVDAGNRLGP